MKTRVRVRTFLLVSLGATGLIAFLSLAQGHVELSLSQVLQALCGGLGLMEGLEGDLQAVVTTIRLPRILLALLAGAALAIAGTIMQAVFRNPLASPEILGTTQGSALGATVAIALGWTAHSTLSVPICAILGALAVTTFVYMIAGGSKGFSISSLLLAGIAMNTLVGALITFAIAHLSSDSWKQGSQILFWLMGSFETSTNPDVIWVGSGLLIFGLVLLPFLRDMDLMTLRDDGASALGVNVVLVRVVLLVLASSLTATTVAFTGGIAFVGLVVPHMARLLVGPAHRALLPCAATLGALMLLISDFVCRVVFPNTGLKVGVVMSMMGAPFFLYLLIRLRRGKML